MSVGSILFTKICDQYSSAIFQYSPTGLNFPVTSTFLLVLSIIVSGKHYFGQPIQCWMPPQFHQNRESFINHHCLIDNTYHNDENPFHRTPTNQIRWKNSHIFSSILCTLCKFFSGIINGSHYFYFYN